MKYLLTEDECTPDAQEYFEREMFEIYNVTIKDFKDNGKKTEFGYEYKGFRLETFPDANYYHLSIIPECKYSETLNQISSKIKENRDYWLFTEVFWLLHDNNDFCNCKNKK